MDFAQNFRRSIADVTKEVASSILADFESHYKWENSCSGKRTALDIGCGDGSVTTEVVKPFLPAFTQLDGADKSEDMIRFVKHCYEGKDFGFFLWDVEDEVGAKSILKSYDHVFSFFCLHFARNQRQAVQNIYNILKPKGNFIFILMLKMPFYDAIKSVSNDPKWSSYMQDFDTMCHQPYIKEQSPQKFFAELMSESGFKNVIMKVDIKRVLFDSWEKAEGLARYVDPFHARMPVELQEEYFKAYFDALKVIDGFLTEKFNDDGNFLGVVERCDVLIGYGEKGSQETDEKVKYIT